MNKETKVMLECMNLMAEYLESKEKKVRKGRPLRKIMDKIYTLFNPNKTGDCCDMEEDDYEDEINKQEKERFLSRE